MSEQYVINDIEEFTDKVRIIVYNNFGLWQDDKAEIDILIDDIKESEQENFDAMLSHNESLTIVLSLVKKQKNRKTEQTRYALDDDTFATIIHSLNERMVSNVLNSLVKKGLVESAFDSESNDFIFWVKDENKEDIEKPETD